MKLVKLLFSAFVTTALWSCAASGAAKKATVTRDCTGTYLRVDSKDWLVCNAEILSRHKEGAVVNAKFIKTDQCPEFADKIFCMMYHENEGLIRITELK